MYRNINKMTYKIGRIYRIEYLEDPEIRYIRSTFNELKYRWRDRKQGYNKYLKDNHCEIAIYPYFKEFGLENFKMILIKEYEVFDRKHLEAYECLWISKLKSINKNNPFRIKKLFFKEYYENNKDKIKSKNKEYRLSNADKLKEKHKEYRLNNSDKLKEKIKCECGLELRKDNLKRHYKSKKHQYFLNNN